MDTSENRHRPRSGPIVWGGLLLAFCAWIAGRTFAPDHFDTQLWLIAVAIGLGVLLLGVGVFIALRGSTTE